MTRLFYSLARSRMAQEEEGIVAILTFLFIATIGIVALFALWGLSYTSGAYTTLYGATQAAAYSAASEVTFAPGDSTIQQLPFQCNSTPNCTSGATAQAAKALLGAALAPTGGGAIGVAGPYGLHYPGGGEPGSVRLLDAAGNQMDGILAFEIQIPPGAAAQLDPDCNGSVIDANGESSIRTCWANPFPDFGVQDQNYVSGVVVVAETVIPFVPLCSGRNWSIGSLSVDLCPMVRLRVSVAARSGQQQAFGGTNEPLQP